MTTDARCLLLLSILFAAACGGTPQPGEHTGVTPGRVVRGPGWTR